MASHMCFITNDEHDDSTLLNPVRDRVRAARAYSCKRAPAWQPAKRTSGPDLAHKFILKLSVLVPLARSWLRQRMLHALCMPAGVYVQFVGFLPKICLVVIR